MAYDALTEGYQRAIHCKANRYNPDVAIRTEQIGNWIVSAKILSGGHCVICIYNARTLMEHYKTTTLGPGAEEAPQGIKEFYQNAFERNFRSVVDLAKKWNGR